MWKIVKTVKKGRYLYGVCFEHPKATRHGYVLLHRLIAENQIGRLLSEDEDVHHKNKNRYDNNPGNLQVLTKKEHNKLHGEEKRRARILRNVHGTLASYKHCLCDFLHKSQREYARKYRKEHSITKNKSL